MPYYEVLLKEIDHSAYSTDGNVATVQDAVSSKIADVVVSSSTSIAQPLSPPVHAMIATPVVADADSARVDDVITRAVTAAQDAADIASAAMSATAIKGAAATKALAPIGAIQSRVIDLTPTKMPFQVDPSKVDTSNAFDASARARENLALIKTNFLEGLSGITDKTGGWSLSVEVPKFSVDVPSLGSASLSSVASLFATLIATLHFKEYGGWYAAGVMAIVASLQRSAGKKEASSTYEFELARVQEKKMEAEKAAKAAADGAKAAKMQAMQMENDMMKDGSRAILESSRLKITQIEKEILENEMRALKAEVMTLRSKLPAVEKVKATTKSFKDMTTGIEEEYPTKVVMENDPDEDGRIIELLKLLDEENATKKKKAEGIEEKKRVEETKVRASEKAMNVAAEKAMAKAEDFAIKAAAEAMEARTTKMMEEQRLAEEAATAIAARKTAEGMEKKKREEETMFVASEKAKNVVAEKDKAEAEDFAIQATVAEATAEQSAKMMEEKLLAEEATTATTARKEAVENMISEDAKSMKMTKGVEMAQAKSEATKKATTKKAVKNTATTAIKSDAKATTKKAGAVDSDNWSTLAESTLKRKSVAQLNEYLTGKGATVTHENGKPMTKSELLEMLQRLKVSV